MHYAEFGEEEVSHSPLLEKIDSGPDYKQAIALREAIKEYEANKWKVIGQKVGKPAKVWRF